MQYSVYEFFTKDENERDWIVALLGDHHFEGFEETNDSLKAYVPAAKVRPLLVKELLHDNDLGDIQFTEKALEEKNWNEEWEKNFSPITIGNKVGIRAPFHQPLNTELELIIEPKMSFGTGHHPTTASMVQLMLDLDFNGKSVLDFGSGTGVLAILAEKLNAANVLAIDNEEWAYNNCLENTAGNNCVQISCVLGNETYQFTEKYDIILANINRNVIVQNIESWKRLMKPGGIMLVSGILQSDELIILNEAQRIGLIKEAIIRNNGWLAISFKAL